MSGRRSFRFRVRRQVAPALAVVLIAGVMSYSGTPANATVESTSTVVGSNGTVYTSTNHLTPDASGPGREWLLSWTGAANSTSPDFLAVIDATRDSPSYGKVVNTVTLAPTLANEAHHMQYVWHKGDRIFAGGLFSNTIYVFDSTELPALNLVGVNAPRDTPCGSAPDAIFPLSDGTAYASYMGGPKVPGPCRYTNGEVRIGNGIGGTPGEIAYLGPDGKTIAEIPAALAQPENDPSSCASIPALPVPSCANPHGVSLREDLNLLIASDFAEARNLLSPTVKPQATLARNTVRIFDISNRTNPKLVSVSRLPAGPRTPTVKDLFWTENKVMMENSSTHLPQHRGAFVASMNGGGLFYTPDITVPAPHWQEIYDDTAAYKTFWPDGSVTGSGDNSGWLMVSPDDRFLFHVVAGQAPSYGGPLDVTTGMVYVLDIRKLLAGGDHVACSIDRLEEAYNGGDEPDCPELAAVLPIRDVSTGGPHWGAMDIFHRDGDVYRETPHVDRLAISNYFIANSFGGDGDHRICMVNLSGSGKLSVDTSFRDENTGEPCVNFNRLSWPHGQAGDSRPHSIVFVVSDKALR